MAQYDRAQTTARIFRAASEEFARYGVAGARVDRIAVAADSSKAMIYNYFGDKETLFAQVLQAQMTELAEAVVMEPDRVGEFVGELFDFMTAHPDILRLVTNEALQYPATASPHFEERSAHYAEKVSAVAEAQARGEVDATLEPAFVVLSFMSLVSWFVAAPQIAHMVIGDASDPKMLARYRAHLVELSRRILTQPAR